MNGVRNKKGFAALGHKAPLPILADIVSCIGLSSHRTELTGRSALGEEV